MARLVWHGDLFLAWNKAFGQEEGPILSSVTRRLRKDSGDALGWLLPRNDDDGGQSR